MNHVEMTLVVSLS